MLAVEDGLTLPGWRDFERSVALALGGKAGENKQLFDVILSRPEGPPLPQYGLSCKMRSELNRIARDGRVTVEVSNSAGKFWDHLATKQINQANYKENAQAVGVALMELLDTWHQAESSVFGGRVDLTKSCYLVLSWSRDGWYQLHPFSLSIVDAKMLDWSFPRRKGRRRQEWADGSSAGMKTGYQWNGTESPADNLSSIRSPKTLSGSQNGSASNPFPIMR